MRRERTPELPLKDWVQKVTVASDITLRSRLVTFLLSAYGGLLVGPWPCFSSRVSGRLDSTSKKRPCTGWALHDWRDRRPPDHDVRLFLQAALTKCFQAASIKSGPVFRAVRKGGRVWGPGLYDRRGAPESSGSNRG